MRCSLRVLVLMFLCVLWWATGVFAAKLICISKETLRGQETINDCLLKGGRIELMKRLNPKAFEQPAYGTIYHREAPEIPKLPPVVIPK